MSSRSRSGFTTSPRTSCGRPLTSGTSARSSPGRSCRRRPRSASTASTSWPPRSPSPRASCSRWRPRSCSGATPASAWPSSAPASRPRGSVGIGTPEQVLEWVPQCYGTPDDVKLGAFCVSEPDAGSDVSSLRTRAVYDEANDEWVLNGTKAWITNGGIADVHVVVAAVDPALKGRGQASFVVPPGTRGALAGPEVQEARHPGVAHGRGRAGGRAGAGPLPARRQGAARREVGQGPRGGALGPEAAGHVDLRGDPTRRRRPRPSASPGRPTSTPWSTPRSAWPSASRSS